MDMDLQVPLHSQPLVREFNVEQLRTWTVLSIQGRVDAFNVREMTTLLMGLAEEAPGALAIDLGEAEFLSFQFIRHISAVAESFLKKGVQLSLVAPSEKLKRQMEIFAKIEHMVIYRSVDEL